MSGTKCGESLRTARWRTASARKAFTATAGIWERKRNGLIRRYGFSFHSGPELLDRILTEHPEAEFARLQIHYADREDLSVTSRGNYEVARKHGKPIVLMELGRNSGQPAG